MTDKYFCPFCDILNGNQHDRIISSNKHAIVIRDNYPLSEGHSLVIPKRHIGSFFDLNQTEQSAVMSLVTEQRRALEADFNFKDCNVGFNDGPLAGQTVPHCHVHIIPRYKGDVVDPRGGIRWVMPDKAKYWDD